MKALHQKKNGYPTSRRRNLPLPGGDFLKLPFPENLWDRVKLVTIPSSGGLA
jgi:hypothetical protein